MDFDGTLVKPAWPEIGEWYPGAAWAMQELKNAGHYVFLYTARLAPEWPDGSARTPASVFADEQRVRACLDAAGLTWMDIWMGNGKPNWDLLIDDKAMWFPGRDRSWKVILPKIMIRVADGGAFDAIMEHARSVEEDA